MGYKNTDGLICHLRENGIESRAYKSGNRKITHFYNNTYYSEVPIWALFEILTMGDFGYLLSCLTYEMKDIISKELGLIYLAILTVN